MKINNILAVDTSTQKLSMSLYSCRKNKIYCYEESVSDHSENLIKFLNKLLIKTNVKLDDITHIGVNTGPGSFTGLRIGLSFVKTLARYLNIKVITTTSFNMILWEIINSVNIEKTLDIITLFPSVKNEFYFCKFRIESKKIIEQKSQIGYIKTDDFYKLEEFDVLAYPDFI
ncbi:MAG: tRNA (adenosine(37)-N6)-threonylcarbamoyltransferase complex dimerization subunit type 1 TsaB [Endomicrobia bacterium]|nr:tRNA (adenosine(37)-N6)-threonylcarbamoyltransferase complex dimerization subunit type 1 TsaB [Endomicrobiia bacterium]